MDLNLFPFMNVILKILLVYVAKHNLFVRTWNLYHTKCQNGIPVQ